MPAGRRPDTLRAAARPAFRGGCRYHSTIEGSTPKDTSSPRTPGPASALARAGLGALVLAIAVAFVVHASAWWFLCDDAFISFRYARNLAEWGSLSFNPAADPLERVEGYTNFGWVLLLATFAELGVAPHLAAPILTRASAAAGTVAAVLLLRRLRFGPHAVGRVSASDLTPTLLLVASPEWMVWSHGGLETALATALVLGTMTAFLGGRLCTAAALAAAAGLVRTDALLAVGAFGSTWLILQAIDGLRTRRLRQRAASIPWRRAGLALIVCLVPLLAHLVWRRIYYGAWLPNTWTVKAHGSLLRDSYGVAYVRAWADGVHLVHLAPLVVLVRLRHALLVVPIAVVVAYGWAIGGDFMAYGRFFTTATAAWAVLIGWLLCDLGALVRRRFRQNLWPRALPVTLAGVLAVALGVEARARWQLDRATGSRWIDGKWEGVTAMHRFALVGFAVGRWMHDNLPASTWITVGAAGAVPYGAGVNVIDAYGLVDPHLASMPDVRPFTGRGARPGHQLQAPPDYIRARDPDLLCHVGHRGPTRPPEHRAHPAFRRGYTWACIDPGPIADPANDGAPFEVGLYCCRRPRDRVVGPFGTPEAS